MPTVPPFFWENTLTIGILAVVLLAVAMATASLLLGLYFRHREREAGVHLIFFVVVGGFWGVSAWTPTAYGCTHQLYCWQFPILALLLIVQCIWLFLRFLFEEHAGALSEQGPKRRKKRSWSLFSR